MFGLIIRKLKNIKIYSLIVIIIFTGVLSVLSKYYQTTKESISYIREVNRLEGIYLKSLEGSFLEQYKSEKDVIKLLFNPGIPIWFRKNYIYDFLPMIYKDIKPETFEIEWTENLND